MAERRGRGEGSVEELPSGRWRAVLSAGTLPDGHRLRQTKTLQTKREALTWLRGKLRERDEGRLARSGRLTLGEHLAAWARDKRPHVEPGSHREYERVALEDIAPVIGSVLLSALETRHVKHLLVRTSEAGASRAKLRKVLSFLRMALNDAVEGGLIPSNVALRVRLPRARRAEIHPYTRDEVRAILGASRGRWADVLAALALDSGMRQGELLALSWADLDLERGVVRVERSLQQFKGEFRLKEPKTIRGRRTILIAPATVAVLRGWRERSEDKGRLDEQRVFPALRGGWTSKATVRSGLDALARRAGVPVRRPHDYRHTCASLLLSAGVNLRIVSERLGHSSPAITLLHYAHLMPGDQERAAAEIQKIFCGG